MGAPRTRGTWPELGSGVGLRPPHYPFVLREHPKVDWFEAVTENYLGTFGRPLHMLEQVRANYPVAFHGVSLSIGSIDPVDVTYLKKVKDLADRIEPAIISDHLCFTGVDGLNTHDLLPLPFTQEAVYHVASKVEQVQDFLGQRILIENVSSYVGYEESEMMEWDFLRAIAQKSDCGILLDLNNVFVNAFNFGFDAKDYIDAMPPERIGQYHLAGHTNMGDFYFDTHDALIVEGVWELYRYATKCFGRINTLIEWDAKIPDFSILMKEAEQARQIQESILKGDKRAIA